MRISAIGYLTAAVLVIGCGPAPANEAEVTAETEMAAETSAPATKAPSPTKQSSEGTTSCVVDEIGTVDDSATLTLGPAEGIAPTTAGGEPMIITGVLLDEDCQPVTGAELAVWQTDASGIYGPGQDTGALQCCYLQGEVTTDALGRFILISVKPGHYQGEAQPPPAHIHVEGHGAAQGLETEIVFAGDPYLPASLDRLVVVDLSMADGVTWKGTALIVMGGQ